MRAVYNLQVKSLNSDRRPLIRASDIILAIM